MSAAPSLAVGQGHREHQMSVEVSLKRLRTVANALPRPGCDWEARPTFDPPATPQSVAEFERTAGFAFPTDFLAFVAMTNSVVGMSIHNGYWIGGVEQLALATKRGDFPQLVEGERAIPVATDGGGNAFLLSVRGCVWRWDHESGKVTSVAESFAAFLEHVADDWDAYVSDRADWTFLV